MNLNRRTASTVFLAFWFLYLPLSSADSSHRSDDQLKTVKFIYIQRQDYGRGSEADGREGRIIGFLTQEMSRKGYFAADNSAGADAILSGTFGDTVAVDARQPRSTGIDIN